MTRFKLQILILILPYLISLQCNIFPVAGDYNNSEADNAYNGNTNIIKINKKRGQNKDVLFILALSGGGSRAAYFSASTMLALENVFAKENINLLNEVDVITSVSGGSLPAAYYAISYDQPDKYHQRKWDEKTVKKSMKKSFQTRGILNLFWPTNLIRYMFTSYDRSNVMAQTFADNIFDRRITGGDYTYYDLNPKRPYIVINATNATSGPGFGKIFTFTPLNFLCLKSNLGKYRVSDAVMASSAFPGAFNFVTLRDFRNRNYTHLFDGGNSDNLGVTTVRNILKSNRNYKKVIIFLIDSFIHSRGISPKVRDPRSEVDYFVDSNIADSFDSLLEQVREARIGELYNDINGNEIYTDKSGVLFYHLKFDDIKDSKLNDNLNSIKTRFKIKSREARFVDEAVRKLIQKDNTCLNEMKNLITKGIKSGAVKCTYQN